jgi:2-(1,2-epoxy-1,2-dihydrophenyl)acetyl-CoA isomerase
MGYETILLQCEGSNARITLNRPDKLNACNEAMVRELQDAVKKVERDDKIRVVVLTGAGRAFSAGQDLDELKALAGTSLAEHLRKGYNRLIVQLRSLEKPIIGAMNGVTLGAAMGIALATDIRIASENDSFIQ